MKLITFILGLILMGSPVFAGMTITGPLVIGEPLGLGEELLGNPSFESSTTGWSFYVNSGVGASATFSRTTVGGEFESGVAGSKVVVVNKGTGSSSLQLYTSGIEIVSGEYYKFSFQMKVSSDSTLVNDIKLMQSGTPYSDYYSSSTNHDFYLTTEFQEFVVYFLANVTSTDARITFYLGNEDIEGKTVYIDSISLKKMFE